MANILGLDLGTNSIGWAIVDDENEKIIASGVRIFPEGIENKAQGDKELSKNAARRTNRQARRGHYRHRLRRIVLLKTLIKLGMCPLAVEDFAKWITYKKGEGKREMNFPNSPQFVNWLKMNPYELRAKALCENITHHQFGRILYHLIQRRGFLSNRKGSDDGAIFKGKENMVGIDKTVGQIENSTLGNFLYSIAPQPKKSYTKVTDEKGAELRIRARYTLRDMYVAEFKKIWERQKENLQLEKIEMPLRIERKISGSVFNKRNRRKIETVQKNYGKDNVTVQGNKIITLKNTQLKEFLAGEIKHTDDSKITFKSNNSLLFYQRPLRSQKGLLAKCSIEGRKFFDKKNNKWRMVGPTPCPISHPEYEEFRALQFINNIEYGQNIKLVDFQRDMLLDLFNSKDKNFEFAEIRKKLKIEAEGYNYDDKALVPGNYTIAKLKPLFDEKVWQKNAHEIWHCFYFFEDNDKLIEKLIADFKLPEKFREAEFKKKITGIKLKDGYSSVSLKAIRNITPFLRKGLKFSDAVIMGGVRNVFKSENGDRWENFTDCHEEMQRKILEINKDPKNKEGDAIKRIIMYLTDNEYGFAENDKNFRKLYHHSQEIQQFDIKNKLEKIENLRNPIVQQVLNEMRRLVNKLIKIYGNFDAVKVELARDLKKGKKSRKEDDKRNRENNKKNEEARQAVKEHGLAQSRENIQKFLLWKEIEAKGGLINCPYTNKTINLGDLLGRENKFQIEHIFPRSTSLDDSFGNKTLCDAKFNALKGNRTPYQFYQLNSDSQLWGGAKSWQEVRDRAFKLLPYQKAKRFTAIKVDTDTGTFIERQLNDTRYISKKAKEILTQICPKDNVMVFPGGLTSELRHLWGLNNILQPAEIYNFDGAEIDENNGTEHWVIFDENKKPVSFHPIYNKKPQTWNNEICIAGKVDAKGVFANRLLQNAVYENLPEGEYWKIIKLADTPKQFVKIFSEKPPCESNQIVVGGTVKAKKFMNDNIGSNISVQAEDGFYWAKFDIKSVKFEKAADDKNNKDKGTKLRLFGEVESARFKSYIFECKTDKPDGKFWAILDLDSSSIELFNARNQSPETNVNVVVLAGGVDDSGLFKADQDMQYTKQTNLERGRYWLVADIEEQNQTLFPAVNVPPVVPKNCSRVEGSVWVNKSSGEIVFDPQKNRNDHRHHAVDAITIAFTKRAYLQKLSTYEANKDEKLRGRVYEKPSFEPPYKNFFNDAKNIVAQILVSFRADNKVLTETAKGQAVRGQLHKETIFGKRKPLDQTEYKFHVRKNVESLTEAQVNKIVDSKIKAIVIRAREEKKKIEAEIAKLDKQKKKIQPQEHEDRIQAEIDDKKRQIALLFTLKNTKGGEPVPIKKVRIAENLGNAEVLKQRTIFAEKKQTHVELNQYVDPQNNHHVALYKNSKGEIIEQMVSFWEATKRVQSGKQVIDKMPNNGNIFITAILKGDMFLMGIKEEYINWEFPDNRMLTGFLYKVQKITAGQYVFVHHFAANVDVNSYKFDPLNETYPKVIRKSSNTFKGIKVKIDVLGQIRKYED